MTVSWDKRETAKLVEKRFDRGQANKVMECMRSVTDRQQFSLYHYREVVRLLQEFEDEHLQGLSTMLELHTEENEHRLEAFEELMVAAGAHALAAVQCLHALPDIFAHVLFFATGQDLLPNAPAPRHVSVQSVETCLKRDGHFKVLHKPLQALHSGVNWKHLAALSNISKHRSVVRSSLNEDWTGTHPRRLQFARFGEGNGAYPPVPIGDLLKPEYERLMGGIISMAHTLNERLTAQP